MERQKHGGEIYDKEVELDFSVNTNPLGMPEAVKQKLRTSIADFEQYPDDTCRQLKQAISVFYQQPEKQIICGNGASDLIFRFVAAVQPKKVLLVSPTFSEYEKACRAVSATVCYHSLQEENSFELTIKYLCKLKEDIDCIFLCNPNNPVGNFIQKDLLSNILLQCKKNQITVFIDECFLDFTEKEAKESCLPILSKYPNVFVLKAFTKRYAMAGLRLGFGFCADEALLKKMLRMAPTWSVSYPAQIAGCESLLQDSYRTKTDMLIAAERKFLTESLNQLGLKVWKPEANYIFFCGESGWYDALLAKKILIRSCENYLGLDHTYYRIAVKKREENSRLIQAMHEIMQQKESNTKQKKDQLSKVNR